jgi:hypothetical protein
MNKLGANMQCISSAEERYLQMEEGHGQLKQATTNGQKSSEPNPHVNFAAG